LRKRLAGFFRGWLPKEPSCANPFPAQAGQQPKRRGYIVYIVSFIAVFAALMYGLGLWNDYATLAAAPTGVLATTVVSVLFRKPNQNKPITEGERRGARIFGVFNVVMVGVFVGTYFLINPNIKSGEEKLGLWIILLFTLFLVNNLLYRNYTKQTGPDGKGASKYA
jgi:membrane protease YdiL (CAAX protease family)